ncbi:hypothetical protein J31TS4_12040 [Paenibacillus sp. J31TS4]|uniref:YqhG family protein n=1 Tax=Paenibacillus sp. J31TS4 TaxID=2807195 RepID=UPI001B052A4B|nr:YqhG family protein [Paenibacillus sp. J31TS4]GIP37924.1 hypothetical protein J31TS4_12040 [Paenibacillus sp. J31TS4]
MNTKQIQRFVLKYLEATGSQIIEKGHAHVTVKLSPEADRELTNRSYYWNFVERTGVEPETMTFTFIFDPEAHQAAQTGIGGGQPAGLPPSGAPTLGGGAAPPTPGAAGAGPTGPRGAHTGVGPTGGSAGAAGPGAAGGSAPGSTGAAALGPASAPAGAPAAGTAGTGQPSESILGRYFGFVPTSPVSRVPQDVLTYGSRRLEQIFAVVRGKGRFIRLFEDLKAARSVPLSQGYSSWFGVNFKVQLACDMKRDELHSLGFDLATGEIVEQFHDSLTGRRLTPKLPVNVHVLPTRFTPAKAMILLENYLEKVLRRYDHTWAEQAAERLEDELRRIDEYYLDLLKAADESLRPDIEQQYRNRQQEIDWQYRPRVTASVINCGIFHLQGRPGPAIDENR